MIQVLLLRFKFGGDEEDRTLDLTDANRTLSQLSYVPINQRSPLYRKRALRSRGNDDFFLCLPCFLFCSVK